MGSKLPPRQEGDREQHGDRDVRQSKRDGAQEDEKPILVIGKHAADLAGRIGRSARRTRKDAAGDRKIDLGKPVEEKKEQTPKYEQREERGKRLAERRRMFGVSSIVIIHQETPSSVIAHRVGQWFVGLPRNALTILAQPSLRQKPDSSLKHQMLRKHSGQEAALIGVLAALWWPSLFL
jgi:hypothetical protein